MILSGDALFLLHQEFKGKLELHRTLKSCVLSEKSDPALVEMVKECNGTGASLQSTTNPKPLTGEVPEEDSLEIRNLSHRTGSKAFHTISQPFCSKIIKSTPLFLLTRKRFHFAENRFPAKSHHFPSSIGMGLKQREAPKKLCDSLTGLKQHPASGPSSRDRRLQMRSQVLASRKRLNELSALAGARFRLRY